MVRKNWDLRPNAGNDHGKANRGKKYNLDPERQAEANKRRSQAMLGNQNARKGNPAPHPGSPTISAEEV